MKHGSRLLLNWVGVSAYRRFGGTLLRRPSVTPILRPLGILLISITWLHAAEQAALSISGNAVSATAPTKPGATDSADSVMEQGKTLFDNGQYVAALDKFMRVLRRDPHNPEARDYLRRVVDQMREQKAARDQGVIARSEATKQPPSVIGGSPRPPDDGLAMTAKEPVAMSDDEARQKVRQRQLLSLDLGAIPGVKVITDGKQTQVEIETPLLFTDKTGGLREEGIPILDRVAAWLKTFGQQPVVIHCYPEELQNDQTGAGPLFLHRYAQLYGFFVDERKMPATRFINTETVKPASPDDIAISSANAKIVIGSIGGAPQAEESSASIPRWLEFSISASKMSFAPEEGDWTSIDLAALTRKGLKSWQFKIVDPKSGQPVLFFDGKKNVLKRLTWDGRDKTGSFLGHGSYLCKLQAIDNDGSTMTQELTLQILRPGSTSTMAKKPKKNVIARSDMTRRQARSTTKQSPGSTPGIATSPANTAGRAPRDDTKMPTPITPKETPPEPEAVAAETAEASEEPTDASIWKQVIQFDINESDLKPTLKASLERIGKTLEVYPLQKVRITGFADAMETNAPALAKQRAAIVRDTLVNEYQVNSKRVINAGGKTGAASGGKTMMKVEISITN